MPSIIPENYRVFWNNTEAVLNSNDIIGRGGEAILFGVSPTRVLKIYLPDRMNPIRAQKNRALVKNSANIHPNAIKPLSIVTDAQSNNDVGIEIEKVDVTRYTLLTNWLVSDMFRQQNSVTPNDIYYIFAHIRNMVSALHAAGYVIGDFNPSGIFVLNKLEWANPQLPIIRMIDIDSLAFGQYPCFVCSLYWCDFTLRHDVYNNLGKKRIYTTDNDWFAFDALMFHGLTSMHPYSGYHPIFDVSKFKFEQAMTVLHPDIEYPIDVMQLADMPAKLAKRFEQTFTTKVREPFPEVLMSELTGEQVLPTMKQTAGVTKHKSSPINIGSNDVYVNVLMDYKGAVADVVVDGSDIAICYQSGRNIFMRQYRNRVKSDPVAITNADHSGVQFVNPFTIAYRDKGHEKHEVFFSTVNDTVVRSGDLGFDGKPILGFSAEGHVFSEAGSLNHIERSFVGIDKRSSIIKTNDIAGFAPIGTSHQIAGVHWYAIMNTYIVSVLHNNRVDRIELSPLEANEFIVGSLVAHISSDGRYVLVVRTSELNGVRRHLFAEVKISASGATVTNQLLIEKLSQLDMRKVAYDNHTVVYGLQNRLFALSLANDKIHEFVSTKGMVTKDSWVKSYENGILVVGGGQVKYMRM